MPKKKLIVIASIILAVLFVTYLSPPLIRNFNKSRIQRSMTQDAAAVINQTNWESIAVSRYNRCYQAQSHGYKYKERFGSRCTLRINYLLSFKGDFSQELLKLNRIIASEQWGKGPRTPFTKNESILEIVQKFRETAIWNAQHTEKDTVQMLTMTQVYAKGRITMDLNFGESANVALAKTPDGFYEYVQDNYFESGGKGGRLQPEETFDTASQFETATRDGRYAVILSLQAHY